MSDVEIKVKLDRDAYIPERAHDTDAGADIRSRSMFVLKPGQQVNVHTGVHIELPPNTVGMIKSKSGLYTKYGITATGVIDEGYTGEIVVGLQNKGSKKHIFQKGEKVAQLVIMPVLYPSFRISDSIDGGERGDNGFGSTGA